MTHPNLKVAQALMNAQKKFDPILKDTNNPFYKSKFAQLDQVIAATRPHLQEEGLIIIQKNIRKELEAGISTRLLHISSGQELYSELTAPPEKQTIQQIASVLTYARRYEYLTILGLAPEDDDGNSASGNNKTSSYTEKSSTPAYRPVSTQSKQAPERPTNANAADSSHSKSETVPQAAPNSERELPIKAVIPANTTESTLSVDVNAIPAKEEYDIYIKRAVELTSALEKAGLKGDRGRPAKAKLKAYILSVCEVLKLEDIKTSQWDILLHEAENLVKTQPAEFIKSIEAAQKESK